MILWPLFWSLKYGVTTILTLNISKIPICYYNHSNIILPPFIISKFSQGQENIQLIYTLGIMLNPEMTILVSLQLINFLNDSIDGCHLTNKMILEPARVSTIPNSIKIKALIIVLWITNLHWKDKHCHK